MSHHSGMWTDKVTAILDLGVHCGKEKHSSEGLNKEMKYYSLEKKLLNSLMLIKTISKVTANNNIFGKYNPITFLKY